MKRRVVLAIIVAFGITPLPLGAQIRGLRQEQLRVWQFSKDGSSWQEVLVPHSYNAEDGHSPKYYRGEATYRCDIRVNDTKRPHYLMFEGAAQAAVVKVNGEQVASHKGGYTPFSVNISDAARKGLNTIEVVCDNREDVNMAPVTSDFNKNGGLHNPVWLVEMDEVYMSPEEHGMYRFRCETPVVTKQKVVANVKTRVVNASNKDSDIRVRVQLLEADGTLGYQADREVHVGAFSEYDFSHEITARGIHFWNGMKDPYLYTVRVELFRGKRMMDIAESKVGFRSFELDPERGFILNGEPYPLRGVAMHQDMDGKASALTQADYRRDYRIIEELGANFLRLAHYPHDDFAFQLCDSLGIIVQTEVPWVNVCGVNAKQAYFNNIRHQMQEMVSNLYNHPCIAFWGMWNEVDSWGNNEGLQGELDASKVVYETGKLYDFTKKLDPYRLVGFTDDSRLLREGYPGLAGDYCSENTYFGWYYDTDDFEAFSKNMAQIRRRWNGGPMNIGEYGVGVNPFCHVWDMSKAVRNKEDDSRHYEEYGNLFHESYVHQIGRMPWLGFTAAWVMFDFPVASRMEGYMDSDDGERFKQNDSRKYMNDKGLVTRDRQTRKDAFYLYKSLWNKKETTVYITSRRLKYIPAGQEFQIKVYSNAKTLTLYQNGRIVTKKYNSEESSGVIWTFPAVRLKTDSDTFKVVANNGTTDEVTFYRSR